MGITANSGPLVSYGATFGSTNGDGILGRDMEYNDSRGPSLFDLGTGIMDPRVAYGYSPGNPVTTKVMGFLDDRGTIDAVPTAVSSNLLAISSNTTPVAGAAVTLLTSKTGVTATTIVAPESGTTTGTLLCLDSTATQLAFGQTGNVSMWNPAALGGRALIISPSSNTDGGSWSVAGRDVYGYKITETFAAGSTTITGQKAFKYVSSVISATTINSTGLGIGTTDRFGMPLYVDRITPNLSIAISTGAGGGNLCTAVVASTTTFLFGSTAATQTSTTPDVRGLYISSAATGSSARWFISYRPSAAALASVNSTNVTGLFGGNQFSSV